MTKSIVLAFFLMAVAVSTPSYCTYHLYTASESLTTVACSDGKYGIMNWGYKDLSPMFPYVTAWQNAGWNNPNCGSCIKMNYKGKAIFITVVDQCGGAGQSHFDISKEAYYQLFGDEGIRQGHMNADFEVVQGHNCKGNKKSITVWEEITTQ